MANPQNLYSLPNMTLLEQTRLKHYRQLVMTTADKCDVSAFSWGYLYSGTFTTNGLKSLDMVYRRF